MSAVENTVFISYCRETSSFIARAPGTLPASRFWSMTSGLRTRNTTNSPEKIGVACSKR